MKRFLSLILCLIIIATPVFAEESATPTLTGAGAAFYADNIAEFINKYYKFDIRAEDLYHSALRKVLLKHPEILPDVIEAMTENLDTYSDYLDAEEFSAWEESLSGSFVGIGVSIEQLGDYIVVVSPMTGSGAELAGILPGDKIVSVDGQNVVGQSIEAVRTLIVGELGTTVQIGVLRGEETLNFTITRCIVEQTTVSYSVTDENLGYIGIASFAENTPSDVKKALDYFDSQKIKKLIIDVRDNPGGELTSLLDTLRLFMPKGNILYINYKDESMNIAYKNTVNKSGKYKIAILANENSASAAEAFAASMKDAKVATLIGRTTFGKGSMQTLQPLLTGGALKLTIALYQTAGGSFVDGVGVAPNHFVKNAVKPLKDNPDILPMQFSLVINESSDPQAIEAAEFRLKVLSISPGKIDGIFDADTRSAVTQFQAKYNLPASGELDITTQTALDNATREISTIVDKQYQKAVELLTD